MDGSGSDRTRRRASGARSRRWRVAAVGVVALLAVVAAWAGYIGYEGSNLIMHGDGKPHGCPTPAVLGWVYEAVNYDIALDDRLPIDNPDWLDDCPAAGKGTAGDEVVSSDGVRLAGWYIPSGDGDGPTAPTVVIVHGWGASKSDGLRYAAPIHEDWNLLVIDTRHVGRSSGDWMSFGAREDEDLRAMLDWLERTNGPTRIAVLGDSGGAGAAANLARTDERIDALILESPHSRIVNGMERRAARDPRGEPAAVTARIAMVGFFLRTGVWLGDADIVDDIPYLGKRPLAISYGTADSTDLPDLNALVLHEAALDAGVPVELHPCEGSEHGQVVDACPDAYRAWLNDFLERTIGGAGEP